MASAFEGISSHLDELRRRLITSLIAVVLCSGVAFIFAKEITHMFMLPLFRSCPQVGKLIYTNLTEAFMNYLKAAFAVGLLVSAPVILHQVWRFVAPGLYENEKRLFGRVLCLSVFLFFGGAGFAYFVVLPQLLHFFLGVAAGQVEPLPKLDAYLGFVARTVLTFGLAFELPFVMVAASKLRLVAKGYFSAQRKYFYLALFVLCLLLTGGDFFSAVLLTGPLVVLYEVGALLSRPLGSPA